MDRDNGYEKWRICVVIISGMLKGGDMDQYLKDFLDDLIKILHEKYNDSLRAEEDESELDKSFRSGCSFAYYDALELIESQLKAFGYDTKQFGVITPEYGKDV
jgi:Mg2+/Co2+ transporter CorB